MHITRVVATKTRDERNFMLFNIILLLILLLLLLLCVCVCVFVNTIVNNTEIGNRGFLGEYKVMHELIDLGGFSGEEKICTQLMRYILQLVICNAFIDLL